MSEDSSDIQMEHILEKLELILKQQQLLLEQQHQQYRQVETLFSLFSQLSLNAPLPIMRGYSISPDFAALLLTQIQIRQPHLFN
jgi:hypothetical protein